MRTEVGDERYRPSAKRQEILNVINLPLKADYGIGNHACSGQGSRGRVAGQHEQAVPVTAQQRYGTIQRRTGAADDYRSTAGFKVTYGVPAH
ncbi:MAG: hypothetical protein A2Y38_05170 [Spirochaetes bacterium GWB1_59_5]|nr:MAG: hypothetical protein A2Y38_05170 [Spirochaetes bacterium GWB1_59_5]